MFHKLHIFIYITLFFFLQVKEQQKVKKSITYKNC